jgi:hypothetical protein
VPNPLEQAARAVVEAWRVQQPDPSWSGEYALGASIDNLAAALASEEPSPDDLATENKRLQRQLTEYQESLQALMRRVELEQDRARAAEARATMATRPEPEDPSPAPIHADCEPCHLAGHELCAAHYRDGMRFHHMCPERATSPEPSTEVPDPTHFLMAGPE